MLRRGFTLIELLLVVTIIAVLIAILIPALRMARNSSNAAVCATNMRQLGQAFMSFSTERNGRLPGNHNQWLESGTGQALQPNGTGPQGQVMPMFPEKAWRADWLAGMEGNYAYAPATNEANEIQFWGQPRRGTIYPYVNTIKAFRCPTLAFNRMGTNNGSNGRYDYTYVQCLNGSRLDRIARTATATSGPYGTSTAKITIATPVLVEEDPANFLNSGSNLDGAWCWYDTTTYNHKGGTNIMTLDGSFYWFLPPYKFSLRAKEIIMRSTATNFTRDGATDNTPFGWFNNY